MVIRLAYWDLCHLIPIHHNGRTAAWEAVEGETG